MIALPSNATIDTLLRDTDRNPDAVAAVRKLDRLYEQAISEDYRTINSDRGPVRGYGGGARGR